jgi:maltodextrin utilization protein YvdJ
MTNDEQYTIINDKTQMLYISILPLQNENKLESVHYIENWLDTKWKIANGSKF